MNTFLESYWRWLELVDSLAFTESESYPEWGDDSYWEELKELPTRFNKALLNPYLIDFEVSFPHRYHDYIESFFNPYHAIGSEIKKLNKDSALDSAIIMARLLRALCKTLNIETFD